MPVRQKQDCSDREPCRADDKKHCAAERLKRRPRQYGGDRDHSLGAYAYDAAYLAELVFFHPALDGRVERNVDQGEQETDCETSSTEHQQKGVQADV